MEPNATLQQTPAAGAIAPKRQREKVWGKPWQKGQTGNPGGRPKRLDNIVDIARQATPKAMRTMIAIMENEKASFAVRAYCAEKVIDRAYGKAPQQTHLSIATANRSLSQLSDAELLAIIARGTQPTLSPPVIDQPTVEVEPSVQPDMLSEGLSSESSVDAT